MTLPNLSIGRTEFELRVMRHGPYYDARTQTLRIPHRWANELARDVWETYRLHWDDRRHEFYARMREQSAFDQLPKARRVFFSLYAAEFPEQYAGTSITSQRNFIVEYYTLSDGRARFPISAESPQAAIELAKRQSDFDAFITCYEVRR